MLIAISHLAVKFTTHLLDCGSCSSVLGQSQPALSRSGHGQIAVSGGCVLVRLGDGGDLAIPLPEQVTHRHGGCDRRRDRQEFGSVPDAQYDEDHDGRDDDDPEDDYHQVSSASRSTGAFLEDRGIPKRA